MTGDNGLWPPLESGYEEEFGSIDPEVHRVAGELWPQAQRLSVDMLHDSAVGYRLLKRATAAVSQLPPGQGAQIRSLPAYLFQTYKRLVLAELEKANGHRAREVEAAHLAHSSAEATSRIDRDILIAELVRRMDSWTRDVFELLVLGYTFDEIGRSRNRNPHVVRNRYRLALHRLAARMESGPQSDRAWQPRVGLTRGRRQPEEAAADARRAGEPLKRLDRGPATDPGPLPRVLQDTH